MPCYTINTVSLDLRAANKGLLYKAAQALGLKMEENVIWTKEGRRITLQDGKAVCDERDAKIVNDLRVAYAKQVVGAVTSKLGWQAINKGNNVYQIQKGW